MAGLTRFALAEGNAAEGVGGVACAAVTRVTSQRTSGSMAAIVGQKSTRTTVGRSPFAWSTATMRVRPRQVTVTSTWSLSRTSADRIDEGVRPAEVVASEASLARLGLTSTVWEDLLLTLPAAFEATLAQHTKD